MTGIHVHITNAAAEAAKLHAKQVCHDRASFMHGVGEPGSIFLMIFLHLAAGGFTAWLRKVTLPPGPEVKTIVPNDVEASAIPDTNIAEPETSADDPPPYEVPTTDTTPSASTPGTTTDTTPAEVKKPSAKLSSAAKFVIGSGLFSALIAMLVLLALDIQAIIFCAVFSPVSIFPRIILWAIYSGQCMWASVGVSCWFMLFRDLWGPAMKKRYPFGPDAGFVCLIAPIILPGALLVAAIEACQRNFCSDALEEDKEEMERGTELREGTGSSEEANEGMEEESVGLMTAMK